MFDELKEFANDPMYKFLVWIREPNEARRILLDNELLGIVDAMPPDGGVIMSPFQTNNNYAIAFVIRLQKEKTEYCILGLPVVYGRQAKEFLSRFMIKVQEKAYGAADMKQIGAGWLRVPSARNN